MKKKQLAEIKGDPKGQPTEPSSGLTPKSNNSEIERFSRVNPPGVKAFLRARDDAWDNSPFGWKYGRPAFEVVGDKLVSTAMMDYLLEYLDGKPIVMCEVISISALLDFDFNFQFIKEEQEVVGDCIGKLIDTGRLVFEADL